MSLARSVCSTLDVKRDGLRSTASQYSCCVEDSPLRTCSSRQRMRRGFDTLSPFDNARVIISSNEMGCVRRPRELCLRSGHTTR
jgi:hypothetical protein